MIDIFHQYLTLFAVSLFLFAIGLALGYIVTSVKSSEKKCQTRPVREHILCNESEVVNQQPVIGIMTQRKNHEEFDEYCMAVYKKYVEQAGARAVPIHYYSSHQELEQMVEKLNGIILPGGMTELVNDNNEITEYVHKAQTIIRKCKELFDRGIVVPIWGVCLGMQTICVAETNRPEVLCKKQWDSFDLPITLKLVHDCDDSRLHKDIPDYLREAMQKQIITYDSHQDGMLPSFFTTFDGLKDYRLLSVTPDRKGVEYASAMEHVKYPIYAIQFHPERVPFIFNADNHIPRSKNALALSRHYADFIVSEARKSKNVFGTDEEIRRALLENVPVRFTDLEYQDIYAWKN